MNKYPVTILLSVVMLFIAGWSGAIAQNHNIKQIEQDDALLQVNVTGAALLSIHAGHLDKKVYLEEWRFSDAVVTYTRISGRLFFRQSAFGEKVTQSRHCGDNLGQNCEVLELKKHSRNLIVIVYRQKSSGLVCAGMDYIDETRSSSRHKGLYGNYIVLVEACNFADSDSEKIIARAAQYLAAVEENGTKKAKLEPYDLPKLDAGGETNLRTHDDGPFSKATDKRVCDMATESGAWQQQPSLQVWLAEAHNRGFTVQDCENILTGVPTNVAAVRRDPGRQAGSNGASINGVDTDKILAYWHTNQNVLRKSISKETEHLRSGTLAFDEFDIVGAQLSQADSQYVELHTVYTLQFGTGSSAWVASSEDSLGTPLYQTLIVNPRDKSVVEVRPATTERPR
jgi:hypothetical protein